MHRADPRAGQHRNRELRTHAHVDRDAVAFLHTQLLQHIGEPLYLPMQLAQRSAAAPRPARPPTAARPYRAAHPSHAGRRSCGSGSVFRPQTTSPGPFAVQHLRPRREPLQLARSLGPERLRIFNAAPVHRSYSASELIRAFAANSAGGGNTRFSRSTDSNTLLSAVWAFFVSAATPLPWLCASVGILRESLHRSSGLAAKLRFISPQNPKLRYRFADLQPRSLSARTSGTEILHKPHLVRHSCGAC